MYVINGLHHLCEIAIHLTLVTRDEQTPKFSCNSVSLKFSNSTALYTYKYTVSEVRIGDCGLSEHRTERETFAAQGQRSKHIMLLCSPQLGANQRCKLEANARKMRPKRKCMHAPLYI